MSKIFVNGLERDTQTYVGLTLSPSNSEVLNTKYCKSISTIGILNSSKSENETNDLKLLILKNPVRIINGQVNIISLRNIIKLLREIVQDKVDMLMISETKLDSSFPEAQFYMDSYSKPYRLDRSGKGGGIMLYVREEIPSKLIQSVCHKLDKEYFLLEINLRRKNDCNYNAIKL